MELHKERVQFFKDVGSGKATLGPAEEKAPLVADGTGGGVTDLCNRRSRYLGFS